MIESVSGVKSSLQYGMRFVSEKYIVYNS